MTAQSVINWTVVGQPSWQYLRRSVAHNDRQAVSAAWFRGASLLATVDTCLIHESDRNISSTVCHPVVGLKWIYTSTDLTAVSVNST